ncbi:hypothetical protein [Pseudarthrobacter phenanthrenivorans]|uniref:hypothetical protein n=1 Tax=Pseudarthrobacter phenanthrenivorans TaxID=361575 RepID=UPI002F355C2E
MSPNIIRSSVVCFLAFFVMVSAYTAAHVAIQMTLLVCMLILSFSAKSVPFILIIAGCSAPVLGLIRRLSAGPDARVDFDPLILFPMVLVVVALLICLARFDSVGGQRRSDTDRRLLWFAVIFSIFVGLALAANGAFSPNVIYFAMALIVPVLLTVFIAIASVPDIWETFERLLPGIGLVVGCYGVYQFFFLPQWDRSWMLNSGLESIGQALPMAVRVFGASESPGPYAAFMGLVVIVCFVRGINSHGISRVLFFLFCALMTVPLLLSGVRSSLLSVLVCAALAVLVRGRGMGRVLPVLFFVLVGVGVDKIVSTFGGSSTILTADRYTSFDPSQDNSIQARLGILDYLTNPLPHVLGNPSGPTIDNLLVDIMRAYGLVPFVLFSAFIVFLLLRCLKFLRSGSKSPLAFVVLYLIFLGIAGNLFLSSFGIIVGLAFGALLRLSGDDRQSRSNSDAQPPIETGLRFTYPLAPLPVSRGMGKIIRVTEGD